MDLEEFARRLERVREGRVASGWPAEFPLFELQMVSEVEIRAVEKELGTSRFLGVSRWRRWGRGTGGGFGCGTVCEERVSFWYHDDQVVEAAYSGFLEFLDGVGLRSAG
ncbi:hypothetical protein ACQHIV_23525 [Kribbella sp. GL6]|uniref:hypothetical protein n=1 Tax=Kribbella sp. GL6 TaxID=3419765 RepID=UPI003D02E85F